MSSISGRFHLGYADALAGRGVRFIGQVHLRVTGNPGNDPHSSYLPELFEMRQGSAPALRLRKNPCGSGAARYWRYGLARANANSADPAGKTTYCFPSTSYVIAVE